jgi:hypothetical protein
MKKIILIICILCFCSIGLMAQYQSIFGNLQTSWNVLNEFESTYVTDSLIIGSDTTINLKTYKKVLFYHLRHNESLPPVLEEMAFIREETATGRAWIIYNNAVVEQLFMNLSLNVNELFFIGNFNYPVDSVYVKDGRKHVRVQYGYPISLDYPVSAGALTFVEGIGTTFGFTYEYDNSGIGGFPVNHVYPFLLCSWMNDMYNYTHENPVPFFDGCYKEDTIVGIRHNNDLEKKGITIFPNPATNSIEIDSRDYVIEKIALFNCLGRKVEEVGCVSSSKKDMLNVSKLPDGIYIIRIRYAVNKEFKENLVIRH